MRLYRLFLAFFIVLFCYLYANCVYADGNQPANDEPETNQPEDDDCKGTNESGSPETLPQNASCPQDEDCCGGSCPKTNSIYWTLSFGRPVNTNLISSGSIRLKKELPSPTLVTPGGVFYASPLNTSLTVLRNGNSIDLNVVDSSGKTIKYRAQGPVITDTTAPDGGTAMVPNYPLPGTIAYPLGNSSGKSSYMIAYPSWERPQYYERVFANGSKARFSSSGQQIMLKTTAGMELLLTNRNVGIEVINANGGLRQIWSQADGLADFVVIDKYSYQIRLYAPSLVGAKQTNGLYLTNGEPYTVYTIGIPEAYRPTNGGPISYDHIRLRKENSGTVEDVEWSYDSNIDRWTLSKAFNNIKTSVTKTLSEDKSILYEDSEWYSVDSNNEATLVKSIRTVSKLQDWGYAMTEHILDPGGLAITTTYDYYSTGKVKSKITPDGTTTTFTYDSKKRETLVNKSFKNSATGIIVQKNYTSLDTADNLTRYNNLPRTQTTKIGTVVVDKRFFAYKTQNGIKTDVIEIAVRPDAVYGDADNLRTENSYYSITADEASAGRLHKVIYPDLRQDTYSYTYGDYNPVTKSFTVNAATGKAFQTTIVRSSFANPNGIEHKTTILEQVKDMCGNQVSERLLCSDGELYAKYVTYDEQHHILSQESSDNKPYAYTWSCCNRQSSTEPDGSVYTYTYDFAGRLQERIKQNGPTESFVFDADDRLISRSTSAGGVTLTESMTYDMAGRVTLETSTDLLNTNYTYTLPTATQGAITTKTSSDGGTTVTEYYKDGQLKSITGSAVIAKYYDYGATENMRWTKVSIGGADSPRWEKTYYNMAGNVAKVEKSGYNGGVVTTVNYYNQTGKLWKTTETGKLPILREYDELGSLIRYGVDVDSNNELNLASADRIIERDYYYSTKNGIVYEEELLKSYPYSEAAKQSLAEIIRHRKRKHTMSAGERSYIQELDSYGNITVSQTVWDNTENGEVSTITHPDSTTPERILKVNGLVVSERNKENQTFTYTYNALEQLTGITDPRAGTYTAAYNTGGIGMKGKINKITDPAGKSTWYLYYNSNGLLRSERNALNKYTYYNYDLSGRQTAIWGGSTYPVSYTYNTYGELSGMTTYRDGTDWTNNIFPTGNTGDQTIWSYDAASGLLLAKTDAAGKGVSYTYTVDGKLASRTWARGLVTNYSYHPTGELQSIDYADSTPDVSQTLTRLGATATITDALGTHTYSYDNAGVLTQEAITGTLYNKTLNYNLATTGVVGRTLGLSIDGVSNHTVSYDSFGRLSAINNTQYGYTANSNFIGSVTAGNGLVTSFSYESNRDLLSSAETKQGESSLAKVAYTNDAIGRRTAINFSGTLLTADNQTVSYNDRSEVTGTVMGSQTYSYAYDNIGNRTGDNENYYYANHLNQYHSIMPKTPSPGVSPPSCTYDTTDGNMISSFYNGTTYNYTYDAENRLKSVSYGTKTIEFTYDFMSRRVEKKVFDQNMQLGHLKFVYNGYKLVEELNGSGALLRSYVWQPQEVGMDVPVTVFNASSNKTYYYHTDGNKNVIAMTDSNGAKVASYTYDAFGNVTSSTGSYAATNPFRFSSEYHDFETGLIYYNYRYYHPQFGRWLTRDPIGELGGVNLYGMCKNKPLCCWDNRGLALPWWCPEWMPDWLKEIAEKEEKINNIKENVEEGIDTIIDSKTLLDENSNLKDKINAELNIQQRAATRAKRTRDANEIESAKSGLQKDLEIISTKLPKRNSIIDTLTDPSRNQDGKID